MAQSDINEHLVNKFEIMEKQMTRVLAILETDEKIKEKGLVEKVSLLSKQLDELLTREKIYKAKATTWGLIGGACGTILIWILKVLFAKFFSLN